ncbi:unnamed protein product, partial [Mesorhabditis spiculigera]
MSGETADTSSSTGDDDTSPSSLLEDLVEAVDGVVDGEEGQLSPHRCKNRMLEDVEAVLDKLSAGWKYHVSNTEQIREAWAQFDEYSTFICRQMTAEETSTRILSETTADMEEADTAAIFSAILHKTPGTSQLRLTPIDLGPLGVTVAADPPETTPLLPALVNFPRRPREQEDEEGAGEDQEEAEDHGLNAYLLPHQPHNATLLRTVNDTTQMPSNVFGAIVGGLLNTDLALVGPPTNVRVQATSNSSAVVEWDFEGEQVDGFVIKYIHEPRGTKDTERWTARTVMSPSARHLEIGQLTAHKPYAFCVLAIRQNRQGSCSDPPATISSLAPTHMVRSLRVKWKTSNSVMLAWDYDPPGRFAGFYLNHTGKKEYLDQQLAAKSLYTPGFRHETDPAAREYLWINLRPYMRYTFQVGVRGESAKQFWPKEVIVVTDPTGPPLVNAPMIDSPPEWVKPGQLAITPSPASEEYGPISHYWIIVIPGNISYEHVANMEPRDMELATNEKRSQLARQISAQPTKKIKKHVRFSEEVQTHEYPAEVDRRERRALSSHTNGVYITAKINAEAMRSLHQAGSRFVVGDEKVYEGITNYPLEPSQKYRLMMRAFAAEQKAPKWEHRPPMSEKTLKMYTDSPPSDIFHTPQALTKGRGATGMWFIGPAVALFVIAIIVFMLVCWWLRCSRKRLPPNHRHGSITKVALGGPINGIPSETSKLLPNDVYGNGTQRMVNPYEQLNGQMESTMDDYGMTLQSRQNGTLRKDTINNYAPLPIHTSLMPTMTTSQSGSHSAIPISQLAPHIDRLRGNDGLGFQQEFESIDTSQQYSWDHSNNEYNKHKNRYANVVAYDHSRVILCSLDGQPGSDYINANYIDGYEKPKAYIATQGPLPETFDAFWRMVWEEGSAMIVMLTNLEERSRVKCDQYWPNRGSMTYGIIQVTILDTSVFAHYTLRTFRVQAVGEPLIREVKQLQYTAWPDHGVPDHPTPFLVFLKRVRTLNPPDAGPIVSHCSAGIGRTGAFIAIDIMLERLRYENTVDVYGCVTVLRGQRSYMVQTEDQYMFIHDAVLDAVNSGSTEVPANRLYQHVQALSHTQNLDVGSGIDVEYRHLSTMKTTTSKTNVASLACNRHKNRQFAAVPYDTSRVILHMFPGVEGSDYINASWLDGYRERNAYIGTQGPLSATVEDFWRMIWETEAAIVVMLTKTMEAGREWSCEYWPHETGVQIGAVIVEPVAEYNMPQYILREFRISDPQSTTSRTVRHFQYTEWPEQGVPRSADTFLDFIQQVHRTKAQFGVVGPMVVHCGGGAVRSGVFIALALLIDRIHEEHVVDVFTTVKQLRTQRSNMVGDKEHYHFLYQAVVEYLAAYDQSAFS